jgi:alanine racemase
MDQIVVDVSRVPGVREGDEAVLLGHQGRAEITVQELARQAGTIPWEILTNVSSRVDRLFKEFRSKAGKV